MTKKLFTALGLMSGTSMDGVDLSLIKSDGNTNFIHVLDDYFEFKDDLREKILYLRNNLLVFEDLKKFSNELEQIDREFTLFNGKIVNKILEDYKDKVDLIGFHGQTVFHDSDKKISKQLGNGNLLSQITQKIVVSDFRKKDLINGGQGAPLTPIFHKLLSNFLNKKYKISYPINILNIGGITNITQIFGRSNSFEKDISALDIAPGNCLIDQWVRKNSKKKFDENGDIAKSGKINHLILNQAIDNFETFKFEKSLDINDFDISFVKGLSFEDGCATLTKFTAHLISKGIEFSNNLNESFPTNNLICGGGRKNIFLLRLIEENINLKKANVIDIDKFKLNGDFLESQAFGYLSIRTFLKMPISFPKTTRCKSPTVGGKIHKNF